MNSTFDSWFDQAYPRNDNGRRLRYQASLVIELMQEAWLASAQLMQERCARACEARFMGDLTREDMEARSCAADIRALNINEENTNG